VTEGVESAGRPAIMGIYEVPIALSIRKFASGNDDLIFSPSNLQASEVPLTGYDYGIP
jgi:hypothetical protein